MRVRMKGSKLLSPKAITNTFCWLLILAFSNAIFLVLFFTEAHAQNNSNNSEKPQLVEIILTEETTDPEAESIVKKLVTNTNPNLSAELNDADFRAKYIPIEAEGKDNNSFIFAIFYNEPFGGCYAAGCMTAIYRQKNNSEWTAVFGAYVHRSYYDNNSQKDKPANLVFSSSADNDNPGVWMWNGQQYMIVNRK